MKRLIALCALALSGTVFASTPNSPPNDVDVSGWNKLEYTCSINGDEFLEQGFFYENEHFGRGIDRLTVEGKVILEKHIVYSHNKKTFAAKILFNGLYVKKGSSWTHYNADEQKKAYQELYEIMREVYRININTRASAICM